MSLFDLYFRLLGRVNYNLWKYDEPTQLYIYNLVSREFNFAGESHD